VYKRIENPPNIFSLDRTAVVFISLGVRVQEP